MRLVAKGNVNERGAVAIFVAVSLLMLMGIAAIAIDGGMAYDERRSTQNAADNAALAGAWALCTSGDAAQAALDSAEVSGFRPPELQAPEIDGDTVTVRFQSDVPTGFGRTQGVSELSVASEARARCVPGGGGGGLLSEAAIVSTGTCPVTLTNNIQAGGLIYTAGDLIIKNNVDGVGPVYTEGSLTVENNAIIYTDVHSNGNLTVKNNSQHRGSSATYVGNLDKRNNTSTWNPTKVAARDPIEIEDPYSASDYAPGSAAATAAGGQYYHYVNDLDLKNNVTLSSGLYYVEGDVSLKNNVVGSNVTIVATGRISIGNNVVIDGTFIEGLALLSTAGSGCASTPAIDVDNNSRVGGTVFAPNGVVDMGNNGSLPGAIIGSGVVIKNNFVIQGDDTAWGGGDPQALLLS